MDPNPPALRVRGVSKSFAGIKALDDVSFDVAHGEVHALLGGNGSGKSTLIKVLAGVHRADPGGTVAFDGREMPADAITRTSVRESNLRFVHQDPGLFLELTVADNVAMRSGFRTRFGRIRRRDMMARTARLLAQFEIDARPDQLLADLGPADRTMVAIARALERDADETPSLLVLDEPTASLPAEEAGRLLAAIRRQARAGQGIIYVSHRLTEVMEIADVVTVLRDGRHAVTRPMPGLTETDLTTHIAGRPIEVLFGETQEAAPQGEVVLSVRGLRGGPLREVTFAVHSGEIVGIAGLLGSGRSTLLRMLFGATDAEAGHINLDGEDVGVGYGVRSAIARDIALVPEDRVADASFADASVLANLSMAQVAIYRRLGRIVRRRERADARDNISTFAIRPADPAAVFSTLSGGNQQKVVLARWLRRAPALLLLDEPTQGVDVGARADIYAAIRRATGQGTAVLLVSSDIEELLHACDRVLVLHEGQITANVHRAELDRERLIHLIYTGKENAS